MPKAEIPGNTINFDPQDGSIPQRTRLALHIGWDKDGGHVQVGVVGYDPETGLRRDIGGVFMDMDWAETNRAIKGLREARDGSSGKPE